MRDVVTQVIENMLSMQPLCVIVMIFIMQMIIIIIIMVLQSHLFEVVKPRL